MDEDCHNQICSSNLTSPPKEMMQYSSDDFKQLQSHCYSCGSETGAFRKYKATRKSGGLEVRFRCGKCRRFTGNIYVKLHDDTYILSRLDPQKYTRVPATRIVTEEVGKDQQDSNALPQGSDCTRQCDNTSDESSVMNTDISTPLPRLKIKIAGGKIVGSTLNLEASKPDRSTDSPIDSPNTSADCTEETSFELLESLETNRVDETEVYTDDAKVASEHKCTVDLAIPSTSTTMNPLSENVTSKPPESPLNTDRSTESGKGNIEGIRRKGPNTFGSRASNRNSKSDGRTVAHDKKISLNGPPVEQRLSTAETGISPLEKGSSLPSISAENQSFKEDAKNLDDESKHGESTEETANKEEVLNVVQLTGGYRRRRPQTVRKHTNARQRSHRISSSNGECSEDDKNEESIDKSVETTQSISVSDSKKSTLTKANKKEGKADVVRDRRTLSETKHHNKEISHESVPSTSTNQRTANTRSNVKQQKRIKTNSIHKESFKIPSISKAKFATLNSMKKTVMKSTGYMIDGKHVPKKLTSCGVQAFLEDIDQHPSTSLVPVSSQTSDSDLTEYLLNKWNNDDNAKLYKEIDSYQMKRRLKMARFVIESQRNEIKKLSNKYCKLEELFCCAKSAFDELKKTLLFELSRVRGDVGSLSSELRLYHLDLKRGCDMCTSKANEDTQRFHLVASKYEEDKCRLKEQLIAKDEEMVQLRSVIDSKTRELLVADRDLHLANETVISIQKKLEDKLFVATNTKCTSCNVFDKYRDVLTTQIADKTTALANANTILSEVRMKLDKQERASKILSKENEKMKFERDIWMADSKRLENEVRLLRAQLVASSANENNSINFMNNSNINTSTPSDGSGSVHRLFGDSKGVSGGISDAHNSPATSSSTSQNLQSPVFCQDKSSCPPPPEPPALINKLRHSNSSCDLSKTKGSYIPSSSKRDNSQPSPKKEWTSNVSRAHYSASKTNGQSSPRSSRTFTHRSDGGTNNKTAKNDIGEVRLGSEKSLKKPPKPARERSSKLINPVNESTPKSYSASPHSSSKMDPSKSFSQTSQSDEKGFQKRTDDENKTTQPNSSSKKPSTVPPVEESETSNVSMSGDSKCEAHGAKLENKSGKAFADSERKPKSNSNKKCHPPRSLCSSLAGHSRWPDVMQPPPHSSGRSKKRKRHEFVEPDKEMMLWRAGEQRRKDDEHLRRLRAAEEVRYEADRDDGEQFNFPSNDHFHNNRAPPIMDSMAVSPFGNDPFCNRRSPPMNLMIDGPRSPRNEFPTWRPTRRGGFLEDERSPHFVDFDHHDRPRMECNERWTVATNEPLNAGFEQRGLPVERIDGSRSMLVSPTDQFDRDSFVDRERWHQGRLMDFSFNETISEQERMYRERLHRERLSDFPLEDPTSLFNRRDMYPSRRIPIEDIPWGIDIRRDERWTDNSADRTFENFDFPGRCHRPM